MRKLLFALTAVLAFAALGCASAATRTARADSDVLTSEQLRSLDDRYGTLYEIVADFRPEWLDPRGQVSLLANPNSHLPAVFVEGTERGLPATLRDIPVMDVQRAEFLDGAEATNRYGAGYPGGAIEVTLRGG